MTDDIDLHQRVARGRRASEFLQHAVFKESFDMLIAKYENDWRDSQIGDVETRETAYRMRAAALDLRSAVKALVHDGEMAEQELRQAETEAQGKGPFT
jgi:hypothetical protein